MDGLTYYVASVIDNLITLSVSSNFQDVITFTEVGINTEHFLIKVSDNTQIVFNGSTSVTVDGTTLTLPGNHGLVKGDQVFYGSGSIAWDAFRN